MIFVRRKKSAILWIVAFLALSFSSMLCLLILKFDFHLPPSTSDIDLCDNAKKAFSSIDRIIEDNIRISCSGDLCRRLSLQDSDKRRPREITSTPKNTSLLEANAPAGHSPLTETMANLTCIGSEVDLCSVLAGKRLLMVGGEHIHKLHSRILEHQEEKEKRSFPCLGRDFCTHHHICLPPSTSTSGKDEPRYAKSPSRVELQATNSVLMSFILSDYLLATPNEASWEYNSPVLDPLSGARVRQGFWWHPAQKADVLVLGRAPGSLPARFDFWLGTG
ncbi:hypothetical protein CONPUDRAFT_154831 [Coniophora puteana RWD-64-598 SS2]|uniref:Uncharacterized protein n=1 Tax=Coniophora puteana (strain RWD-64-598) TaxID=741705 RepID=A0A5M3MP76_CONPW|nr:uncharacterized protein CONPUDRAFT_154831 [Coniophora puteana RWD-64-598 SS2]EIW80840.1 hypothetical protein CONPUDRAFT_154831 [Coniophora puteana RWD-64-598 SS2]